jgi:polyadenylate-binding protein
MMQKSVNNIYVKNYPQHWDEAKLREVFGRYGHIKSLFVQKQKVPGQEIEASFAFICFEHPDGTAANKDYGIKAAVNAIADLNGKEVEGQQIYVREALKKSERDQEKKKEQIKFKNSKKRCNLYIKNFPPETSTQELKSLFETFGVIESLKIFPQEGQGLYAFACFQSPEAATMAKNQLNAQPFNGKQLYINLYEMKETRKAQQEEMRDRVDW